MAKAKIVITGGAGYIGSILVTLLLEKDYAVTVVDNLMYGGEPLMGVWHHNNFEFVYGDIRNKKFIEDLFTKNKYDGVVHLAA